MHFDYLHSPRPALIQRVLEMRIPERLQTALFALCGAIAVILGAWTIEAYRLRDALMVQAAYQAHYDATERELRQANLYYNKVHALVDLDRRVHHIGASGDADARTLAEIADRLPEHAWLTGISHDSSGLALEGDAKSLSVLSGVLHGLMHAKHLRSPVLNSAALDKPAAQNGAIRYEIHVEESERP